MVLSRRRLLAMAAAFSVAMLVFFFGTDYTNNAYDDWQPDFKAVANPFATDSAVQVGLNKAKGEVAAVGEAIVSAVPTPLQKAAQLGRPAPAQTPEVSRGVARADRENSVQNRPATADGYTKQADKAKVPLERLPQQPQQNPTTSTANADAQEMVKRPDGHVVVLSEEKNNMKESAATSELGINAEDEMKKEEARRAAEAERKEALMRAELARQIEEQKKAEEAAKIEAARVEQEAKELAWEAAETGKKWGKYEDVAVIIRTGFQVQKRLEGPFSTYLKDRKEDTLAVFSDRDSEVMGRKVYDCVKPFFDRDPATFNGTNMHKIYENIQTMNSDGSEIKPGGHNEGWKLDIMKQTMSADLGYQMLHKNRRFKWWAIIDDDTYLHLPTLSAELSKVNHTEPHYFGSPTWCGGTHFAHGGSGIILSAKAMSNLFENRTHCDRMHAKGLDTPYGDHNLAVFLKEIGIPFENQFRHSFHGDPLEEVRFKLEHVCAPLFTLHHLQEAAMKQTHEVVNRDRLTRFWDVLDGVTDFKDMSLWYKENHSYNLWVDDDLALESEVGPKSDKKPKISEKMPTVKIDSKHNEEDRPKMCERLCHSGELSKGCITWTYVKETRDCYMADWFMLNTNRPRKGCISGILAERMSEWRRAPCYW